MKITKENIAMHKAALPSEIRQDLIDRCISEDMQDALDIGMMKYKAQDWIVFPVYDRNGAPLFLKLKRPPKAPESQPKSLVYPKGAAATLYPLPYLPQNCERIVICEGEPDALVLLSCEIPAVTSTAGAGTFHDEWLQFIPQNMIVTVCFDLDEAGRKGMQKVLALIYDKRPDIDLRYITLPSVLGEGGDITDFFRRSKGEGTDPVMAFFALETPYKTVQEDSENNAVLHKTIEAPALPILPISEFKELHSADVIRILGSTVKRDDANKVLAFLAFITVYTDDAQFNLTFQAPSASGKSYIALEAAQYFPKSDVMKLAYSSPQAFFHEQGQPVYSKEPVKGKDGKMPTPDATLVNLEGKIIIFVDQPHAQVLERLRPILSHDEKEIHLQITDKQKGGGQRTKKIIVRGYPVVVFCTACLSFDEQEATRFLMLSPETTQGKLHEGILSTIERGSDREAYRIALDADPDRRLLQQRVIAIKSAKISDVIIRAPEKKLITGLFLADGKMLKPRHQRDVPRFMNIMKAFALLNFMFRERKGSRIVANAADFEETKALWVQVNESQEYNLSPYFMQLYKELIVVTYNKANEGKNALDWEGITKKDILKAHHITYQRPISDAKLRQEILPALETAGLIEVEKDKEDKRIQRITPLLIDGDIVRRGGEEKPIQSSDLPF